MPNCKHNFTDTPPDRRGQTLSRCPDCQQMLWPDELGSAAASTEFRVATNPEGLGYRDHLYLLSQDGTQPRLCTDRYSLKFNDMILLWLFDRWTMWWVDQVTDLKDGTVALKVRKV